jgi:hypothetical protein
MVADTERNYTGTNTVVITLIVLLVLVGGYFIISQAQDVADDGITATQRSSAVR